MMSEAWKAEHLRKVHLRLAREGGDREVPYTFVFGIGSQGLSPLEMALEGKTAGEEVALPIPVEGLVSLFGHLPQPALGFEKAGEDRTIRVRVERVGPARDREVIQAMAEASECGSNCCGH